MRYIRMCGRGRENLIPVTPHIEMRYDPGKYHRRSIRLNGYDYSMEGAYFVTIVAQNRECIFGDIVDCEMRLNDLGELIQSGWGTLPERFPNVELDGFVVMPNHFHGIMVIRDDECRGEVASPTATGGETLTGGETPPLQRTDTRRPTLGSIVAYYKYETTKRINAIRDSQGTPVWQRNYYDHIVRNDRELNRIREYIANNAANWNSDADNPNNVRRA